LVGTGVFSGAITQGRYEFFLTAGLQSLASAIHHFVTLTRYLHHSRIVDT